MTPRAAVAAVRRRARWRRRNAAMRLRLRAAGWRGRPRVLVGPFLSEVGFELLYWIPMVRQLCARAGITRDQVVAVSRGGCTSWYADLAASYVDVLDLMADASYRSGVAARRVRAGDQKQSDIDAFDRLIVRTLRERRGLERAVWLHPALMFTGLRPHWTVAGAAPPREDQLAYRPISPRPTARPGELPDRYVAVKAYFSPCFPATDENKRLVGELVTTLCHAGHEVVLLNRATDDDHPDVLSLPPRMNGLHDARGWITPRDNLEIQTAVVAGSSAFCGTYGGFSYLAQFLGIRATGMYSVGNFNSAHLAAMTQAGPTVGSPGFELFDTTRSNAAEIAASVDASAAGAPERAGAVGSPGLELP